VFDELNHHAAKSKIIHIRDAKGIDTHLFDEHITLEQSAMIAFLKQLQEAILNSLVCFLNEDGLASR